MKYQIEAQREVIEGTIILGSRIGYSGEKVFSLKDITRMLHSVNEERASCGKKTIPCITSPGVLTGRSTESRYQEEVYNLQFSASPRSLQVRKTNFFEALKEYAISLGQSTKQTRVYIKFNGKMTVLKRK